jgi:Zn-dependent protease/CBS domain-containing protein
MRWSIPIGRLLGVDIKLHLTFFLLLAWDAHRSYQLGGQPLMLFSLVFIPALFACVLAHEFGHILMARRFGIATRDIILSPIGGIARLEGMPERPREEVLVALAGPAVTLAIAAALGAATALTRGGLTLDDLSPLSRALLPKLMAVNVWLLVFNLLPIFPMDGGRVLRALLAARHGLADGTRRATRIGQVLAGFMVALGLFGGSLILLVIGGFIFLAGEAEARAVEFRAAGRGVTAGEMMVTRFVSLRVYDTLDRAAQLLLDGEQREFPVLDNLGRIEGLLTRDALIRGLASAGPGGTVEQAMVHPVDPVAPDLPFDDAVDRLRSSGLPALPVVDPGGRLSGLLTWDNVTDLVLVRQSLDAVGRKAAAG